MVSHFTSHGLPVKPSALERWGAETWIPKATRTKVTSVGRERHLVGLHYIASCQIAALLTWHVGPSTFRLGA